MYQTLHISNIIKLIYLRLSISTIFKKKKKKLQLKKKPNQIPSQLVLRLFFQNSGTTEHKSLMILYNGKGI